MPASPPTSSSASSATAPSSTTSLPPSPRKLDPEVRIALRLGIYQIRHLERVPRHAAVSESVDLVKRARKRSAAGMVNAVLRRVTSARRFPRRCHPPFGSRLAARPLAPSLWRARRPRHRPGRPPPAERFTRLTPLGEQVQDMAPSPSSRCSTSSPARASSTSAPRPVIRPQALESASAPSPAIATLSNECPAPPRLPPRSARWNVASAFRARFDRILVDPPLLRHRHAGPQPRDQVALKPTDLEAFTCASGPGGKRPGLSRPRRTPGLLHLFAGVRGE